MKSKLNSLEKKWVLYDVANSAFTLLVSTIFPIYFNSLAKDAGLSSATYLAYWGYAISLSTLLVVIIAPLLGAASDKKGRKKVIFSTLVILGSVGCALLGFAREWLVFLVAFSVIKIIYQNTLVIYDSTLADVTTEDRYDLLSAQGYAWGYIGSCVPFILCLLLILNADKIGMSTPTAMTLAFLLVGIWWLGMSTPILRAYQQKHFIADDEKQPNLLKQLGHTLKQMVSDKKIILFVVAFFFYIDGVYTIIDMSTAYGTALGLDSTSLLLALLVTQFVAFPSALVFGSLSKSKDPKVLITACIGAYFCIALFAVFMSTQVHFWILACCVGVFQGGIQSLSRSYFTKIIPPERSGEYFSLLDICGKGASIFGTMIMAALTQITGNQRIGVAAIALFFVLGMIFFRLSAAQK